MKLTISLLLTFFWLQCAASLKSNALEHRIEDFIPVLETEADFLAWADEIEEAVEIIETSRNGTSRNFFEDKIIKVLSSFFVKAKSAIECKACKVGIGAAHRITQWDWTLKPIISVIDLMCRKSQHKPKSVCKGVSHSSGTSVFKILRNVNMKNDAVAPMACYAFGNICPMPHIPLKTLPMPAKVTKSQPKISGKHKYILHISDLHYDREYREGAEANCAKPICCQADSNSDEKNPKIVRKPASKWGEYTCDANKLMLNSLLNKAAELNKKLNYDMVLFTGDLPAHDMWKEAVSRSEQTEAEAYQMISTHLPPKSNNLYPVIGNHESVPLNQFPFKGKLDGNNFYLYNFVADQWKTWLPEQSLNYVRYSGFYSVQHSKDLKVLVLNNNLYYTLNFYSLLDPTNPDPNGMFKWMINELQDAENKGIRVYIASHVPPGSTDFYQHWSDSYHRIIERYAHLISGQFYGHLHTDEFGVFYSGSKKTSQSAVSASYLAPSMSTMNGINPSFRVYKVDADTYEVIDYTQYYADLKQKSTWKKDADWQIMYTARQAYGFGSDNRTYPTLNGAFWHRATEFMERDQSNFNTLYDLRHSRGLPKSCDAECRRRYVCTLRAGRSRDNCAVILPFS